MSIVAGLVLSATLFSGLAQAEGLSGVWTCNDGAMIVEKYTEPYTLNQMSVRYQLVIHNKESNGGASTIRDFESKGITPDDKTQAGDFVFKGLQQFEFHSVTTFERDSKLGLIQVRVADPNTLLINAKGSTPQNRADAAFNSCSRKF